MPDQDGQPGFAGRPEPEKPEPKHFRVIVAKPEKREPVHVRVVVPERAEPEPREEVIEFTRLDGTAARVRVVIREPAPGPGEAS